MDDKHGNVKRDHSKASAVIERANYYEAKPPVNVFAWSPEPAGTPNAKATQVHLHFGEPPGNVVVVRFKGPATLDALIAGLQEHRAHVWGPPSESTAAQFAAATHPTGTLVDEPAEPEPNHWYETGPKPR